MAKKSTADKSARWRVYRIAKELEMTSKELVPILKEMGYPVKTFQSTLSQEEALSVIQLIKNGKITETPSEQTAEPPSAQTEKRKKTAKSPKSKTKKTSSSDEKAAPAKKETTKAAPAKKETAKKTSSSDEKAAPAEKETAKKASSSDEKAAPAKKETTKAAPAKKEKQAQEETSVTTETIDFSEKIEGRTSQEYMRDFVFKIVHDYFDPEAKVLLRNGSKNSQQIIISSSESADIPNLKELLESLRYILGKLDTYHFDGKIRYSLSWDGIVEVSDENESVETPAEEEEPLTPLQKAALKASRNLKTPDVALVISGLSPKERREIHLLLAEQTHPKFRTFSDGEGIFRRLVIGLAPSK